MTVPERNTPRISWFAELGITDRTTVGGKGASLGELIRAGAAVPPGFVVTTAAFETFLVPSTPTGGFAGASTRWPEPTPPPSKKPVDRSVVSWSARRCRKSFVPKSARLIAGFAAITPPRR